MPPKKVGPPPTGPKGTRRSDAKTPSAPAPDDPATVEPPPPPKSAATKSTLPPPPANKDWSCDCCGFVNGAGGKACKVCDNAKPATAEEKAKRKSAQACQLWHISYGILVSCARARRRSARRARASS